MAKKDSLISINKLSSVMNKETITIPMPGVEGTDIVIKRRLSLVEMMEFVDSVVGVCVDEDTGEYHPEFYGFAVRANILSMYANFRLPADIEKQYELLYNTDMVDLVLENIDQDQYGEIEADTRRKIRHKTAMMRSAQGAAVDELMGKVAELLDKINSLAEQNSKLYENISPEETAELLKKISELGDVDERALVHAVFDAQKGTGAEEEVVIQFPRKD